MKSLKPFFLVLAGVLITVALFSFKNEEPKNEYCRIEHGNKITVYYEDRVDEKKNIKGTNTEQELVILMNQLSSQGWKMVSNSSVTRQVTANSAIYYTIEYIYLERTKQ